MRRVRNRLAAALGLALTLACAPGATDRAEDAGGRPAEVVIGTRSDLAGVNDLVSGNDRFTSEILDLLFVGLLEEEPDWAEHPPSLSPSLARSWELSEDGRSLVFHLDDRWRWSDGAPVTADDVVFTWRAQIDSRVAWPYAQSKDRIEAVEAADPRTVIFRLRDDSPYQLVDINDGRILPRHAWSALPLEQWKSGEEWFLAHFVASGPYTIREWKPGRQLVLAPNPEVPQSLRPRLERVVFLVVPDPAALVERLLAGEIDVLDAISPRDAERIAADPRLRLVSSDSRQFEYIAWNGRRPPFDDPAIRRALTLAIDREAIAAALWRGWAKVGTGPIPIGVWARDAGLEPWPYDPARARELLAESGFRDLDGDGTVERDGKPFRFELATNSGNRLRADATALIRDQLRRVGIDARPRTLEIQTLFERAQKGEYDAMVAGWAIDTTLDLRPYFHSGATGGDGWNFVGFAHDEADRLLDEIRAASDVEKARPLFHRLQRILHEQQPYTFLCEPQRVLAADRDIEGIEVTALSALASLPRWSRRPEP